MLKESDNPPIIWPEDSKPDDFEQKWWVIHTKSRNEKALAHDLISREVRYFLPMRWKVHHSRNRKLRSLVPLFNGYMFFCGEENDRIEVLKTNRAANLIEVFDQKKLVRQLSNIYKALASGANIEPHQYIKEGQRCRVTSGPLKDMQGVVSRTANQAKLILKIDMLGQAACVEIDTDLLEIMDN